jgi:DNA-binding protein
MTRSPNDSVRLNADGDLVVEGARGKAGEPRTLTIKRRVHVKPEVICTVNRGNGAFTYNYKVANAPVAKQWIQIFWVDVFGSAVTARAPEYWRVYNIDRSKPPIERVFFGRDAADQDEARRLNAGSSQDGFVLESPARPGLVRFFFVGHKPLPGEPGHVSDEVVLDSPEITMSDWLRQEANKHLSMDTNSVVVSAIGPKVMPAVPAAQAIRNELLEALRNPNFVVDRESIEALVPNQDRAAVLAGIQGLLSKATGLRAEFYSVLLQYY